MKLSKKMIKNGDNVYSDIRVCSLKSDKDKWHSIIAVNRIGQVIKSSNHFLENYHKSKWQESNHKIYSRIDSTYEHVINSNINTTISEESFLMANSFSGVNSGHDLSILLDSVNYIRNNKNIKNVVLLESSKWWPNNLNLVKFLLRNVDVNFIYLEFSVVYNFNKMHIIPKEHMKIMKHSYLIDEINLNNSQLKFDKENFKFFNRKVILLKCHRNSQVTRRDTALVCENLINLLENDGYIFINPENFEINLLIKILQTAKIIVSGWGGILYTNMPFFNTKSKIFLLMSIGFNNNYHWNYITSKSELIYNVKNNNLDENLKETQNIYNLIKKSE